MIKLLPFCELLEHNEFVRGVGLCSNLNDVYEISTGNLFKIYLQERGLSTTFPIGVGGYMTHTRYERLSKARNKIIGFVGGNITANHRRMFVMVSKHDDIYYGRLVENRYEGMQLALRHNLYNDFCNWLVLTHPAEYSLGEL